MGESEQTSMKSKFYPKGSVLFREGDKSSEMYYIESGSVAILCKGPSTSNVPVSVLKKGSFVGEFAFFDDVPRSATVMMMEDTTLKIIDQLVLKSIGKNGIFIIRALVEKLRTMNQAMIDQEK
jgi:CRP-like cAMP-binding protein